MTVCDLIYVDNGDILAEYDSIESARRAMNSITPEVARKLALQPLDEHGDPNGNPIRQ